MRRRLDTSTQKPFHTFSGYRRTVATHKVLDRRVDGTGEIYDCRDTRLHRSVVVELLRREVGGRPAPTSSWSDSRVAPSPTTSPAVPSPTSGYAPSSRTFSRRSYLPATPAPLQIGDRADHGEPRYQDRRLRHREERRDDLHALGVVGYEALGGRRPFTEDNIRSLGRAIMYEKPRPLPEMRPDAGPGLVAVIERAIAHDPSDRFESARERSAALGESEARPDSRGNNGSDNN